jgi:hypothetical protein
LTGKVILQSPHCRSNSISAPPRALLPSGNTLQAPVIQGVRHITSTQSKSREDRPKSTKGLHPTILSEDPPPLEKQSEEVKQHNREMDERAERVSLRVKLEDTHKDKESMLKEGENKEKRPSDSGK